MSMLLVHPEETTGAPAIVTADIALTQRSVFGLPPVRGDTLHALRWKSVS